MSEVIEPTNFSEPIDGADLIDYNEVTLDEELKEDDEKGIGKGGWYIVFAVVIIAIFLWILLGFWGYLQEMSYGHG